LLLHFDTWARVDEATSMTLVYLYRAHSTEGRDSHSGMINMTHPIASSSGFRKVRTSDVRYIAVGVITACLVQRRRCLAHAYVRYPSHRLTVKVEYHMGRAEPKHNLAGDKIRVVYRAYKLAALGVLLTRAKWCQPCHEWLVKMHSAIAGIQKVKRSFAREEQMRSLRGRIKTCFCCPMGHS
jgi:hypothetical protein